jgi:NTP pyrophosphatase (non-canonical NTP hydrolase)
MQPYQDITVENFSDWVEAGWTRKVESPDDSLRELAIMTLGLVGEAGEVSEHIKKNIRGDGPVNRSELTLELGDVLHYLCRIARTYRIELGDIMRANIDKIERRRGQRAWEQKIVDDLS